MVARMLLFSLSLALTGPPAALAAGRVGIELNKLEDRNGACRAYLVFQNDTESRYEAFKLDLVMFDAGGVIAKRLAVEVAPLRPAKTSVKLFDLEGLACPALSRILINDVIACRDQGGERADCIALIEPASRQEVSLVK